MDKLTVVGGGSAGCRAALYGAKNGLAVTLYEPGRLGGTCLHTGCIPTKAMLHGQGSWEELTRQLRGKLPLLEAGMAQQLRRAGVQVCRTPAPAQIDGPVLLAFGGPVRTLPQVPGKRLWDHRSVWELTALPQELAICGGGVSGLEFAQIFAGLGVSVTVYEQQPRILPDFPAAFARHYMHLCMQEGIAFVCDTAVEPSALPQTDILLTGGGSVRWPAEMVTRWRQAGLDATEQGICTDRQWRTSLPGVYAVGDCTTRTRTAFGGAHAAKMAVDSLLGRPIASMGATPQLVCGWYDLACVGSSQGLQVCVEMGRSGYAFIRDRLDGRVALVCDEAGCLCGAQLLFPGAAEAISLLTAAINCRMPVQVLAQSQFFHPSYTEQIQEAASELYDLYRKQADGSCL